MEHKAFSHALSVSTAKYATAATPGAKNDLTQIIGTAKLMGRVLMPWQIQVSRIASERDPLDPTRFRYDVIVITVPRQSGKTTLMATVLAQRALCNIQRKAFYSAQTGKDATERWLDLVNTVERSSLAPFVKKRIAAGSQRLTVLNTGSTISPFAPTADSLHGYTPSDVMLDEVFAFTEAQGNDLMGAIKPAQVTVRDKQLWLVSTAGTADSVFLKNWVTQGRLAVNDPLTRIAYFEWSLDEGLDPYDPANFSFHPAVGYTIDLASLMADASVVSAGEWVRAYANQWTNTVNAVMDIDKWIAVGDPNIVAPSFSEVSVAYEVAHDRSSAAIYGAWKDALTGKPVLKLLKRQAGTEWLPQAVADIYDMKPKVIGADDGGETRALTDTIKQTRTKRRGSEGVEVMEIRGKDFGTATSAYLAHIDQGSLIHDGDAGHLASAKNAATRPMGDSRAFSRKDSAGPIPELIAACVALRLHEQAPASTSKPKFRG